MAERSEAKSAKRSSASKIKMWLFDAKLRFALLAPLHLAIFSQIFLLNNQLVILPKRVKIKIFTKNLQKIENEAIFCFVEYFQ